MSTRRRHDLRSAGWARWRGDRRRAAGGRREDGARRRRRVQRLEGHGACVWARVGHSSKRNTSTATARESAVWSRAGRARGRNASTGDADLLLSQPPPAPPPHTMESNAMRMEGFLRKNHAGSSFGKKNARRYFVTEGFTVFYYSDANKATVKGHFDCLNVVKIMPFRPMQLLVRGRSTSRSWSLSRSKRRSVWSSHSRPIPRVVSSGSSSGAPPSTPTTSTRT